MTRMLRPGIALLTALVLLATLATLVLAQDSLLGGKLRTGDTITVPASETVQGDLYLLAGTATMDGTVDGDLVVFGGQVTVNGSVGGDLMTAGGTVALNGEVAGDVRTAGGQVTVSGAIGEDALVAGGQPSLGSGGTVAGDLIISGGAVTVAGTVTGNIEGSAGTYSRSGPAPGGTEHVVLSSDGDGPATVTTGDRVMNAIRHFVILFVLGALLLWLLPRMMRSADETLRRQPLRALGGGLLTVLAYIVFVVVAILVMILLAIVFGLLQLGALVAIDLVAGLLTILGVTFVLILAIAYVADIVVGLAMARAVAPGDGTNRWRDLALLAAGVAVVVVITSLPIIGGIAKLLVICFGLGALGVVAWRAWRARGREAAVA